MHEHSHTHMLTHVCTELCANAHTPGTPYVISQFQAGGRFTCTHSHIPDQNFPVPSALHTLSSCIEGTFLD